MEARLRKKVILIGALAISIFFFLTLDNLGAQGLMPLLDVDLQINTDPTPLDRVKVAFDGNRYLVVWSQYLYGGSFPSIFGRFVESNGDPSGDPFQIGAFIDEFEPDVAFNGSQYMVVWRNSQGVTVRSVEPNGTLGSVVFLVSEPNHIKLEPAVATDGTDFLVVWRDSRNFDFEDLSDIWGQVVSINADGNPRLEGNNFIVSLPAGHQTDPAIAYGDGSYLVTWTKDINETAGEFDLRGAFVSTSGNAGAAFTIAGGSGQQGSTSPAEVAFDGTNFLTIFNDDTSGINGLYGVLITPGPTLTVGSPFLITENPDAIMADTVFGDTDYLVVWGGSEVWGTRVDTTGQLLDPVPIDLSVRTGSMNQFPAIAYGSGDYFVAWEFIDGNQNKYAQLITTELLPEEQLDNILDFIDDSVAEGSLEGTGFTPGMAERRLDRLENLFERARDNIEQGQIGIACIRLTIAYLRCDGNFWPLPDFVSGESRDELADMTQQVMDELGYDSFF